MFAAVLHHVGGYPGKQNDNEQEANDQEIRHPAFFNVHVHEILRDEIRLDQRDSERSDQHHIANMGHGADDAHDQQYDQDGPDLDVIGMMNVSFSRHVSSS